MAAVMTDMELDDDDKLDTAMPYPMPDKPQYPYGLRICLTEKELEKLGFDPADMVKDGMFHLHGMARITDVHTHDGDSGSSARIEAQIFALAIESEDAENED